jgi:hypothetical protein
MANDTKTIELWPCRYEARCKVRNCRGRATTIARVTDGDHGPLVGQSYRTFNFR